MEDSLERMFSETDFHNMPTRRDLMAINSHVTSESNYGSGGDDYVDKKWKRQYETSTYKMRTTIIGTTINQLEATLNTMTGRIGNEFQINRNRAIIVQVLTNREHGVTVNDIYKGNRYGCNQFFSVA